MRDNVSNIQMVHLGNVTVAGATPAVRSMSIWQAFRPQPLSWSTTL